MIKEKYKPNENSDLITKCTPLNESLFKEIYNEKLWIWYKELGLIKSAEPEEYLRVVNGRLLFNEEKRELRFPKTIFQKILSTMKFSKNMMFELTKYEPEQIDRYYRESQKIDFEKLEKKELLKKFEETWKLLIENFKYSILAGLVIQYNLHVKILEFYKEDINSKKLNAIKKLQDGTLKKEVFDKEFGFYSIQDYDFSSERYYELKLIPIRIEKKIEEKESITNFREHVKKRNIMLIAIIRKILLAMNDKDIFYKYKDEILEEKEVDISKRKANGVTADRDSEGSANNEQKAGCGSLIFSGLTVSGRGKISGRIKLLNNPSEIDNSCKDKIIVTKTMHPDLVVLIPITLGIVTETGGKLSHLAIVARETNYPVICQVEDIFDSCKNVKELTMNLDEDIVKITQKD